MYQAYHEPEFQRKGSAYPNLSSLLLDVARDQQEKHKAHPFLQSVLRNKNDLFKLYRKTDHYQALKLEAEEKVLTARSNEEIGQMVKKFTGAVFEYFTYLNSARKIYNKSEGNSVLLSAWRSLKVYEFLFPEHPLVHDAFGMTSLEGITVPDGIIIKKEGKDITSIRLCEYSTTPKHFDRHIEKYANYLKDLIYFKKITDDIKIRFVFLQDKTKSKLSHMNYVEIIESPLNRKDFYRKINLMMDLPNEEDTTIRNVIEKSKEQLITLGMEEPEKLLVDLP